MKERITAADLWLLDRVFQAVADLVRNETGATCFSLARGALAVAMALDASLHAGSILVLVMTFSFGAVMYFQIHWWESNARENTANRAREQAVFMRLTWILLTFADAVTPPFHVSDVELTCSTAMITATFYFASCQLRPRRRRRAFAVQPT